MTLAAPARLEQLAASDPVVAPAALLRRTSLEAAEDPVWREAAERVDLSQLHPEVPVLKGRTISVDAEALAALARRLDAGLSEADLPALLRAALAQDADATTALAGPARIPAERLMVLGEQLAAPLLLALGERAAPLIAGRTWSQGYCPVCAAWPLLAELRGLDRQRVLRCGRCATAWPARHGTCVFCGNDDHRTLAYVSRDDEREHRRVSVCERCRGYLKALATLGSFDTEGLAIADLGSVELDIAAMDRGYSRPERALDLEIEVLAA